jgi:hypothetical protein
MKLTDVKVAMNVCGGATYWYMCVLIMLYMSPPVYMGPRNVTNKFSHHDVRVVVLLYMCPHTTTCVLRLFYMCPLRRLTLI